VGGGRTLSVGDIITRAHNVAGFVATVKKYAELSPAQRSRVESVVQRQHQERLDREKEALGPKYAKRRAAVQKRHYFTLAQSPAQAAKAEAESRKQLAVIDADWENTALKNVNAKYGSDSAVPMENPDGKPVVAFASVRDGSVQVASSAYEVGGKVAKGTTVKHGGKEYAVGGAEVFF
jgi:hypothetical protein